MTGDMKPIGEIAAEMTEALTKKKVQGYTLDHDAVLNDIYRQRLDLLRRDLKPSAVVVGDFLLRSFCRTLQDRPVFVEYIHSGGWLIFGMPVYTTPYSNDPFRVLTDGGRA